MLPTLSGVTALEQTAHFMEPLLKASPFPYFSKMGSRSAMWTALMVFFPSAGTVRGRNGPRIMPSACGMYAAIVRLTVYAEKGMKAPPPRLPRASLRMAEFLTAKAVRGAIARSEPQGGPPAATKILAYRAMS